MGWDHFLSWVTSCIELGKQQQMWDRVQHSSDYKQYQIACIHQIRQCLVRIKLVAFWIMILISLHFPNAVICPDPLLWPPLTGKQSIHPQSSPPLFRPSLCLREVIWIWSKRNYLLQNHYKLFPSFLRDPRCCIFQIHMLMKINCYELFE